MSESREGGFCHVTPSLRFGNRRTEPLQTAPETTTVRFSPIRDSPIRSWDRPVVCDLGRGNHHRLSTPPRRGRNWGSDPLRVLPRRPRPAECRPSSPRGSPPARCRAADSMGYFVLPACRCVRPCRVNPRPTLSSYPWYVYHRHHDPPDRRTLGDGSPPTCVHCGAVNAVL